MPLTDQGHHTQSPEDGTYQLLSAEHIFHDYQYSNRQQDRPT